MDNVDYINSCKKNKGVGIIISGLVVVLLLTGLSLLIPNILNPTIKVQLGDGFFRAKVVKSGDQQISLAKYEDKKGDNDSEVLGVGTGINIVEASEAILVVFPEAARWDVTLSGLRRSVDIVWLDINKKVSYIAKNVSPDNFDMNRINPRSDSIYILKLAAGVVDSKSIIIGAQASFRLDEEE